jgi:hypothetical protein
MSTLFKSARGLGVLELLWWGRNLLVFAGTYPSTALTGTAPSRWGCIDRPALVVRRCLRLLPK